MSTLAVIILNWRDSPATLRCAASVISALRDCRDTLDAWKLIVVDNDSGQEHVTALQQWQQTQAPGQVALVLNDYNRGFAGGMNSGIERAQAIAPDYIWLLNNDTEVAPDSIAALLTFSGEHEEAAIVGSTILEPGGRQVKAAGGWRYYTWLGYSRAVAEGAETRVIDSIDERLIDYLDGAALWLRADFLTRIGGIPDKNFLYGEELELNQRLSPSETFRWCREARVEHAGGASTTTVEQEARSCYHAALSIFDYSYRYHRLCLPTVIAARVIGISLRAIWQRKPKLISAVMRAVRDHFRSR